MLPFCILKPNLCLVPVTALLFKMEEANIASRAKAQEFIQATSQVSSVFVCLPYCNIVGYFIHINYSINFKLILCFVYYINQILSQANQSQAQSHSTTSSSGSQVPPPPSHAPPPGPTPTQFILHGSLPLVGCTKTPPTHLHPGLSLGGGCAQTPPPPLPAGLSGAAGGASETGWDGDSKDPDKVSLPLSLFPVSSNHHHHHHRPVGNIWIIK